jgi:hypothetical protein
MITTFFILASNDPLRWPFSFEFISIDVMSIGGGVEISESTTRKTSFFSTIKKYKLKSLFK